MERFTKRAREVVERAQSIAVESRASQVRPEHLFAAILWDDQCLAVRVLNDQGATSERLHSELDRRRARYVDGLDDEDAAALASIGIDLAEVVRRLGDEPQLRGRSRFTRGPKKSWCRSKSTVICRIHPIRSLKFFTNTTRRVSQVRGRKRSSRSGVISWNEPDAEWLTL